MGRFTITEIRLYRVLVPLKKHFSTHLQTVTDRESIFVELVDSTGMIGLGECVAFSSPWYTEETVQTCWDTLINWLVPTLLGKDFAHPSEVVPELDAVKGNRMAKACLDQAAWDLYARRKKVPLWKLLGGVQPHIDAGVVLTGGMDESMLQRIQDAKDTGYKRVKVKIDETTDAYAVKKIVENFQDILFFADANGLFDKLGLDALLEFDHVGLTLIEQPFGDVAWDKHVNAAARMHTAIALDESICSVEDARRLASSGAGDIIVLKPGRVGGTTEALKIIDVVKENDLGIWIGGMIEFGVSKAHNMALASLPEFSLPGDFSASSHFWEEDPVEPPITIENGAIQLRDSPGIGVTLNKSLVEKYLVEMYNSNN